MAVEYLAGKKRDYTGKGKVANNQIIQYDIMHGNQKVADLSRNGTCHIYDGKMMPYNLYLEQPGEEDIDIRLQNLDNFYHWCASRTLTLDREYAKEILNSIGVTQSVTDKDRAQVALSYHCLSLMDVPMEYFEIYCRNQEIDRMEYILKLDGYSYYMMNIIDYLVGNTDRHWSNWGLLVDNKTNEPLRLYDLMDFNRAFRSYDTLDGAGCLTTPGKISQRQAAEEAAGKIGLPQTADVNPDWFAEESIREMFYKRLAVLQTLIDKPGT